MANGYGMYGNGYYNPLGTLGGMYNSPAPAPARASAAPVAASGGNYNALAKSADAERIAQAQRATQRQGEVIGGYDTQITNSRARGEEGYQRLSDDYAGVTADALATRERNMARVEQYGTSMRDDLNRKNTQNLAKASQSAIMRGLGNTTIHDSLVRGQNFDNNRQMMSLEDQLLQNRISTDSNLSNVYQNALQNRAQMLGNQWNLNTQSDNALATGRLNYIGGINENMDGFNSVANLYSQGLQMQNANQQAYYDRRLRQSQSPQASTGARKTDGGFSFAVNSPY